MPETLRQSPGARAKKPRRVGIPLSVGERVVPPVIGDPLDGWPLTGTRPSDPHRDLEAARRLEGAVGEVSVETDADTSTGDRVEHGHQCEIDQAGRPEVNNSPQYCEQRSNNEHPYQQPHAEPRLLLVEERFGLRLE